MDDSTRKQRLRQRRREAGWKAYEVWLDATGQDLLEKLRQPGESVDTVLQRSLRGLQAETSLVPRDHPSLVARGGPSLVASLSLAERSASTPALLDPSSALDALAERIVDGVAARLMERLALQPPPERSTADTARRKAFIDNRLLELHAQKATSEEIAECFAKEGILTDKGLSRWQPGTIRKGLKRLLKHAAP
jgi:hypothetical protein